MKIPDLSPWLAQSGFGEWLTETEVRGAGELRLTWAGLPESWGVFVWLLLTGLAVTAVIWLYRREPGTCPPAVRTLLAALRTATILSLILLLLKPSVFYQQTSIVRPTIAILRDNSISMVRGDSYADPEQARQLAGQTGFPADQIAAGEVSRQQLVDRLIGSGNPALVDEIRRKANLSVHDFSVNRTDAGTLPTILENAGKEAAKTAGAGQPAEAKPEIARLECDGVGTDLWQALRESLEAGERLSAIVVVSEGQHNGSEDPRAMARRAAELEIPIFTVGVGDPTPRRNFSVEEVFVRSQAYPGESFEIESMVDARLPPDDPARNDAVRVSLLQQPLDSAGKPTDEPVEVQVREVAIPPAGSRIRVDFGHTLDQPGQYQFTVVARSSASETSLDDNQRTSSTMTVIDEKVRVLLVSGLPNWEYIQLQRLLQRDANIELSCWLQSMDETRPQEGDSPITTLPRSLVDLGQYNVVILIDPNPEEFDAEWIAALESFLRNKAGGFLYMAGPQHTAEFLTMNRLKGFLDILPVRFADGASIAASQVIAEANNSQSGSMQVVGYNLDHPIMSFHADRSENEMRWSQFPGFAWSFPCLGPKPTARVLIEAGPGPGMEGNQPVLATGRFGSGNVVYFGFMGTWLWRSVGVQAQYFDRFWIQVMRFLVENRSLQGVRRGVVDSDQTEYELGNRINLMARLRDAQFQPLQAESVPAIVQDTDGRSQKINLQPVPGQPGSFSGTLSTGRLGTFTVRLEPESSDSPPDLYEPATFRVVAPSVETGTDWLNEPLMRDLASISGGQYLRLDEIGKLPALLPRLETRAEFNSPSQPAWDLNRLTRFGAFLFPLLLLCLEWALRKWYRLL